MTDGSVGEGWEEPPPSTSPPIDYSHPPPPVFSLYHEDLALKIERKRLRDIDEVSIEADFTPRCTMQHGIQSQKDAVQAAVTVTESQWHAYASMLSPPPSKCKYPPLDRPPCPFVKPPPPPPPPPSLPPLTCTSSSVTLPPCLCFLCAGFKAAKPKTSPCVVCGALIPYSICDKQLCATVPVLCFLCKCVFTD